MLIAFFGGLAGIIGQTRLDKTNTVIPGVAIATVLMPPLCTCGYSIANGRWDRVEPNDDCWEAVQVVMEAVYDYSGGALYFESCADEDNWHSRNLEFLYESDGLRFYK